MIIHFFFKLFYETYISQRPVLTFLTAALLKNQHYQQL